MKKLFLVAVIACASQCVRAQTGMRKLTPAEVAYYTQLYRTLYTSMPHTYKNWKVTNDDAAAFDINNYWCQDRNAPDNDCRGRTLSAVGTKDPYTLVNESAFAMTGEESGPLMAAAIQRITDFTNAAQIAAALKATANAKLSIQIVANIDGGDFALTYCSKTPPATIKLPVPATLALKGIRAAACPLMSSGAADMHADYYDAALIFLGKPVAEKTPEDRDDGLSGAHYKIGFDRAAIGKPVTQNIVVTIRGDSADIDAAIALIDWKQLYALIGK